MAFSAIKLSILTAVISFVMFVINATNIGSDVNDGRKISLTLQEPNEEDVLTDYNPLSNQAIYLDKIDRLGALIGPKQRITSNLGQLASAQLSGYENHKKRQIRYHQCYFNPISCFRKK